MKFEIIKEAIQTENSFQDAIVNIETNTAICYFTNNDDDKYKFITLMCLAPEMLEALNNIIEEYDLDIVKGIDAKKIRELISKATTI